MPGLSCKLFFISMFPWRYVFDVISAELINLASVLIFSMVASFSRMSSRSIVECFPISLIAKLFRHWYVFRYEYEHFPASTSLCSFGACATSLLVCHDWLEPHDMTTKQSLLRPRSKSYSGGNPLVEISRDRRTKETSVASTRDDVPNLIDRWNAA